MLNPLSGGGLQAALGNAAASSTDTPSKTAAAASSAAAGKGAEPAAPDRGAVEKAVEKLNQSPQIVSQGLRFSIDDETGKTVIKVIDTTNQNVLRQFPSKEALALAHAIDEMQHGLLLREKA